VKLAVLCKKLLYVFLDARLDPDGDLGDVALDLGVDPVLDGLLTARCQ
jgi:hypothetical protein